MFHLSKMNYKRILQIKLPKGQSAFLWGARKTGKSTYLKANFPDSVCYDLLQSDLYLRFSKEPYLFRQEILALPKKSLQKPIIVDEVQKIPLLLDEIHWLIENYNAQFMLCGSSTRKLKRSWVNLLGGRAWGFHFYPLVFPEIVDFDLLKVLNIGTLPAHYIANDPKKSIKAYIHNYLTQEIQIEGAVRNLPAFARFLDSVAFSNSEMINYNNIARDCGIDAKTVKEYYQILLDTLLGYYIFPFKKQIKRDIILATPKFYLFDVGIANGLAKRKIEILRDTLAGKALEHYILLELMAYLGLNDQDDTITYWRTKTGLEVDFILGDGAVAIEVNISNQVKNKELKALIAFQEEHSPKALYVVALEPRARKIKIANTDILVLPVAEFLTRLWDGNII